MERARRADAAVEAHERGLRWCARKHDLGALARERVAPRMLDRVGDEVVDAGDVEVEGVEGGRHVGGANSGASRGGERRGEASDDVSEDASEASDCCKIPFTPSRIASSRDSLDIRAGLMEDELNCSGEQQEHDEHEQVRTEIFALVNAREPGQRVPVGAVVRRVRRVVKHDSENSARAREDAWAGSEPVVAPTKSSREECARLARD